MVDLGVVQLGEEGRAHLPVRAHQPLLRVQQDSVFQFRCHLHKCLKVVLTDGKEERAIAHAHGRRAIAVHDESRLANVVPRPEHARAFRRRRLIRCLCRAGPRAVHPHFHLTVKHDVKVLCRVALREEGAALLLRSVAGGEGTGGCQLAGRMRSVAP